MDNLALFDLHNCHCSWGSCDKQNPPNIARQCQWAGSDSSQIHFSISIFSQQRRAEHGRLLVLRQLDTLLIPPYVSHYYKYDNPNNSKLIAYWGETHLSADICQLNWHFYRQKCQQISGSLLSMQLILNYSGCHIYNNVTYKATKVFNCLTAVCKTIGLNADKYMHRVESEFETEPDFKARRIALWVNGSVVRSLFVPRPLSKTLNSESACSCNFPEMAYRFANSCNIISENIWVRGEKIQHWVNNKLPVTISGHHSCPCNQHVNLCKYGLWRLEVEVAGRRSWGSHKHLAAWISKSIFVIGYTNIPLYITRYGR